MSQESEHAPAAVEVAGLTYRYKRAAALAGVSFRVSEKSIHGFVGPNGAGKTTTLKILATLLKPRTGTVRVGGMDVVRHYKKVRRRIGYMPDHLGLYRQMTVAECLDFFAAAYGLHPRQRGGVIEDVLALTDMSGRKDSLVRSLSRGMLQRVSLARTLVHDPDLLLLDEPAAGLDPRARIELMEILRELRRMGKTIFISSHILSELADLCDSVTIIDRGHIRYTGAMDGLLSQQGDEADYVLTLQEDKPGIAEALLAVDGVTIVGKVEDKPVYELTFHRGQTDTNTILRTVMASGATVASFSEESKELSHAFMEFTEPGVPT